MSDRDARSLLEFIIQNRLATLEEKQAEFSARALDPGDQPTIMAAHEVQTEEDAAGRLFPAFVAGLRALDAQRAAGGPLALDDSDPQQSAMADALIRFLVKSHLATVESEDLGEGRFRYQVTADWAGLQQTATLAKVDLDAALSA